MELWVWFGCLPRPYIFIFFYLTLASLLRINHTAFNTLSNTLLQWFRGIRLWSERGVHIISLGVWNSRFQQTDAFSKSIRQVKVNITSAVRCVSNYWDLQKYTYTNIYIYIYIYIIFKTLSCWISLLWLLFMDLLKRRNILLRKMHLPL